MSNVKVRVSTARQKSGLKSAKTKAASLARSISSLGSNSKKTSVGTLILEKVPSEGLEGDFQIGIWAHG